MQRHLAFVGPEPQTLRGMVEEQIFTAKLSVYCSSVFPDRLNSWQKDNNCEISITFHPETISWADT